MDIPPDLKETYKRMMKKRNSMSNIRTNKKRLEDLCENVASKWKDTRPPYPFTPHDHTHCIKVEEMLYKLFTPEELNGKLEPEEIFLLLASVWLHDVGMIPKLFPNDKEPKNKEETIECDRKVRETHEKRSENYIRENKGILKLTDDEADALMNICRFHRYKKYEELQKFAVDKWKESIRGFDVRISLLAACLRLADACHVPHRADVREFKIYMALGLDVISKIHWLASKYASDISADTKQFKINIVLKKPITDGDDTNWLEKMEPLRRTLVIEVQDEVDAVREILVKGGLSVYLTVECTYKDHRLLNDINDLEELLTDIRLLDPTMSPTASSVIDIVLKQIDSILDLKDKKESIRLLKEYKTNVFDKIMNERSCHVFSSKVKNFLDINIPVNSNNLSEQECNALHTKIKSRILGWKEKKENAKKKLPEMVYPFLADGSPILLYGYSSSIVECLKYLVNKDNAMKETIRVYVCQCATKNKYRYNNRLMYCDGIKYMQELNKTGIKNISYITDSCVSNLFSNKKVKKVLFGANGINHSGYVAHSLGHLAVADMAKTYGARVIVITDSLKIGDYEVLTFQRGNQWLTTDILFEQEIESYENYNPREDIIPPDRIDFIITEKGITIPNEIGRYDDDMVRPA